MFARFQAHSSPLARAHAYSILWWIYDRQAKTFDFNAFAINSDENVLQQLELIRNVLGAFFGHGLMMKIHTSRRVCRKSNKKNANIKYSDRKSWLCCTTSCCCCCCYCCWCVLPSSMKISRALSLAFKRRETMWGAREHILFFLNTNMNTGQTAAEMKARACAVCVTAVCLRMLGTHYVKSKRSECDSKCQNIHITLHGKWSFFDFIILPFHSHIHHPTFACHFILFPIPKYQCISHRYACVYWVFIWPCIAFIFAPS